MTWEWLAYLLALACFVAATFNARVRPNLVAAGLALWILPVVIHGLPG